MKAIEPIATKTKATFRQSCADVHAAADTIWAILTDAANYPNWNSTATRREGDIRVGEPLSLRVTFDPKRTFARDLKRAAEGRAS